MNTYVRRALAGLVAATALTGSLLAAVTPAHASFTSSLGGSISRSEVIERAQYWVDHQPGDYNQGASSPGPTGDRNYRRDCSGFVDMAWHLNSDPNTQGLPGVSTEIARTDLQAGDILDSYYDHVILFNAWEADHVHYSYYAFGATPVHFVPRASINDTEIDSHPNGDYKAYRYNKIIDDTAVKNVQIREVMGDWDGNGSATPGIYRDGVFQLRNSNSTGVSDVSFTWGNVGNWIPIAGKWGGGSETKVGLYDPATSTFHLRWTNTPNDNRETTVQWGNPGWIPIAGNWAGDAEGTKIGIYDPSTGTFHLRWTNTPNDTRETTVQWGNPGWIPLAGNWGGGAVDKIGVYDPATSTFHLRWTNTPNDNRETTVKYGPGGGGWTPLAGNWGGDGTGAKIGTFEPATANFNLRWTIDPADERSSTFGYGNPRP